MPIVALLTTMLLALASGAVKADAAYEYSADGIGPKLSTGPDGTLLLSYIDTADESAKLVYHNLSSDTPGQAHVVAAGTDWFINWADYPSVVPLSGSVWAAHWLVKRPSEGLAYDIHVAVSHDAGQSWEQPFLLHDDGTATEHGFVTLFPQQDMGGAIWLDGRNMQGGHGSSGGMTLRGASFGASGGPAAGEQIDDLTCDCCQTDVAITDDGPVAVYRDRSPAEIRDIYTVRYADGGWQEPLRVHEDGWEIAGCPVNGPVVVADGNAVLTAWFTAADNQSKVKVAWSHDSGRSFSEPLVIDDVRPLGYVGAVMQDESSAWISWLCRVDNGDGHVCYRRVSKDGPSGAVRRLPTDTMTSRMSVPQIAMLRGELVFVWTENAADGYHIKGLQIAVSDEET